MRRDLGRCSVWGVQDVLGIHALLSCWRLWCGSLAISGTVCRVAALAGAIVGWAAGGECRPSVRVSYQLLVRRLCSLPVLLGLLWLVKPAWPCPALMRTAPESR